MCLTLDYIVVKQKRETYAQKEQDRLHCMAIVFLIGLVVMVMSCTINSESTSSKTASLLPLINHSCLFG